MKALAFRLFGRLLGTVEFHVRQTEAEWRDQSMEFRRHAYGPVRRWLVGRFARPLSIPACVLTFGLAWTFIATLPVPKWFEWSVGTHQPQDVTAFFTATWSIQAAIAALVYPIVIAFVTILVQRQHGAKASLYVYLNDAAAISSALSALSLVCLMAFQYLWLSYVMTSVVVGWVAFDTAWLLFNLLLTGYFLYRTFEFILPSRRVAIIRRYALSVAWPAEVRFHLANHIFLTAVESALLPGPAYGSDAAEDTPSILTGNLGIGFGANVVDAPVRHKVRVRDISLKPLAIVASRWKAREVRAHKEGAKEVPALSFPIGPDDDVEPGAALCTILGTAVLPPFERRLVRWAYDYGNSDDGGLELTVGDTFAEIQGDARNALNAGDEESFRERITDFIDLLELLIAASSFRRPGGDMDNFTAISDRNHVFRRPTYQVWGRRLLDLAEAAARRVDVSDAYILRLAYAANRLYDASLKYGDAEMARYCINLYGGLFHYLAVWWVRAVEEQGVFEHDPCREAILRPPQSAMHDGVLRGFVGAWESLKNEHFPPSSDEKHPWEEFRKAIPSYDRHLHETAVMFGKAVAHGDGISSEWLATVLTNWFAQMEYRLDTNHGYVPKEHLAIVDQLFEPWEQVKAQLGIDGDYVTSASDAELVFSVSVKNLADDVACVVASVLVIWGRNCVCETSLPARLLQAFIRGGQSRRSGETIRSVGALADANALLRAVFRQCYSPGAAGIAYRKRLNATVSSIDATRARDMVPGRIYGGAVGQEGLNSLLDGWLLLLLVLVPADWRSLIGVGELLGTLVRDDNPLFRRCIQDLGAWIQRLEAAEFREYKPTYECLKSGAAGQLSFEDALTAAVTGIRRLLDEAQRLQNEELAVAPIDGSRLTEIGLWASGLGFTKENGGFPIPLFASVTVVNDAQPEYTLVLRDQEKGQFTAREMGYSGAGDKKWFEKVMRDHVSVVILREVLRFLDPVHQVVSGAQGFWSLVKTYESRMRHRGLNGALFVNGLYSPQWISAWVKRTERNADLVPQDLVYARSEEFEAIEGYLGNIGSTPVFRAPVARGESYLIPLQAFNELIFRCFEENSFVRATVEPVAGRADLVNLRLSWQRSLTLVGDEAMRITVAPDNSDQVVPPVDTLSRP